MNERECFCIASANPHWACVCNELPAIVTDAVDDPPKASFVRASVEGGDVLVEATEK